MNENRSYIQIQDRIPQLNMLTCGNVASQIQDIRQKTEVQD